MESNLLENRYSWRVLLTKVTTDDLDALLDIIPPHIRQPLCQQQDISELLEVVLDLGRPPEARFPHRGQPEP